MYDLQKASFFKRLSAYIFDMILVLILAVGFGFILSSVMKYDDHYNKLNESYEKYQTDFDIVIEVSPEAFEGLSAEDKANYEKTLGVDLNVTKEEYTERYYAADAAMQEDEALAKTYSIIAYMTMIIVSVGSLLSYLILEFAIPVLFGNGQTLGKKIFSIAVMQHTGVKVTPMIMFIRTVLGKYTIGTMIPILSIILIFFDAGGMFAPLASLAVVAVQLVMLLFTENNLAIHDKLSSTVVVDMQSQMIFESKEALIEYQKRLAAERAEDRG